MNIFQKYVRIDRNQERLFELVSGRFQWRTLSDGDIPSPFYNIS